VWKWSGWEWWERDGNFCNFPLELRRCPTRFTLPQKTGAEDEKLIDNRVCDVVRWLSFELRRDVCCSERSIHEHLDSGRDLWTRSKVAFGELTVKISWRV